MGNGDETGTIFESFYRTGKMENISNKSIENTMDMNKDGNKDKAGEP